MAKINNVFGGAESLEGNISFGTKTRQAFQLRLEAPVVSLDHSLKTRGEISAFSTERDFSSFASASESVKGLKFALRVGTDPSTFAEFQTSGLIVPTSTVDTLATGLA